MPVALHPSAPAISAAAPGVPGWVADRGGDVRAFDRRTGREVYGPAHPFHATTDLLVTNGMFRFWVGNAGMVPFLNVQAFAAGQWHESGCLALAADDANALITARLVRVTPDAATCALTLRAAGDVFVTLRRGERFLRIQHGAEAGPAAARAVRWMGTPPANAMPSALGAGAFNTGLRQSADDDVAALSWPADVPETDWTVVLRWTPDDDSDAIAASGLGVIVDDGGDIAVNVRFDDADGKAKLTAGLTSLATSSPLVFSAGDALFVAYRIGATDGTALSTKTPTGALQHAKDVDAINPGTDGDYAALRLTGHGPGTWGEGTWGEGTWGGGLAGNGVMDNIQIFRGYLSDVRLAALADATVALDGVAGIEGQLRSYWPFDIAPVLSAGTAISGFAAEITDGADGLRRFVSSLDTTGITTGVGLSTTRAGQRFAAGVATAAAGDTADDLAAQAVSAFDQEVRVR